MARTSRTPEQRKADWAKYYEANKEKLKAKRALKPVDKEARAEFNKDYYVKNKERLFARLEERRDERLNAQADYRANNPEKVKARHDKYYNENRSDILAKLKAYKHAYPERRKASQNKYRLSTLDKQTAKENKRRAGKLNATPTWADSVKIQGEYTLAKKLEIILGTKFHVDHIVPLKSKLVCGLHCEANLQVIPSITNLLKGNRHWPDMP